LLLAAPEQQTAAHAPRLAALDGLRGWAAVAVCLFHFSYETFGVQYPGLRNIFTASLLNGRLAVALFFALSAYVLTYDSWGNSDKSRVVGRMIKRYPRLTIPIFFSAVLVFVLMSAHLVFNHEAAKFVHNRAWLGPAAQFQPDFWTMVGYGLRATFTLDPSPNYNSFLWTMYFEFWGSLVLLALCFAERWLRDIFLPLILFCMILAVRDPTALPIGFGGLLALLHRRNSHARSQAGWTSNLWAILICGVAVFIAGSYELRDEISRVGPVPVVVAFSAIAILSTLSNAPWLRWVLERPVSQFLGRISFPLYILQYPVLISFTSWLIIEMHRWGTLNIWTADLISLLSFALTVGLAILIIPVESLAILSASALDKAVRAGWAKVASSPAVQSRWIGLRRSPGRGPEL
jgi:peptidoglycan/LPS O-acetylase OafA/YrhL